jgi:hypothetical protein
MLAFSQNPLSLSSILFTSLNLTYIISSVGWLVGDDLLLNDFGPYKRILKNVCVVL